MATRVVAIASSRLWLRAHASCPGPQDSVKSTPSPTQPHPENPACLCFPSSGPAHHQAQIKFPLSSPAPLLLLELQQPQHHPQENRGHGLGAGTAQLRSERALAWVHPWGLEVTLEVRRSVGRRGTEFWDVNWAISRIWRSRVLEGTMAARKAGNVSSNSSNSDRKQPR